MSDPTSLTLTEARDAIRRKTLSARELTEAHIGAMEAARPLNLFITETADRARAMAEASDARVARGEAGPLEGLPLGIKDLYCTDGVQTTAGSHILEGFVPGYESTVSAQLWRDGAVMLGKLNLDEFAMGSSNETSYFGPAISPWRRPGSNAALVPGGSSGGSAAAVAAQGLSRGDRDRHGRLHPPARGLHRHGRHQADLWPLFPVGHRGLRVIARPGRARDPYGPRCRHHVAFHGGSRPEGLDLGRPRGSRLRGRDRPVRRRQGHRHSRRNIASTACRPRSTPFGRRASNG